MWRQTIVLLWIVLFVVLQLSFSQSTPSRDQQIEAHNRQAAEYLKENEPELAVPGFEWRTEIRMHYDSEVRLSGYEAPMARPARSRVGVIVQAAEECTYPGLSQCAFEAPVRLLLFPGTEGFVEKD
jgi:hypothetical protein